jgi:hypothetical protein
VSNLHVLFHSLFILVIAQLATSSSPLSCARSWVVTVLAVGGILYSIFSVLRERRTEKMRPDVPAITEARKRVAKGPLNWPMVRHARPWLMGFMALVYAGLILYVWLP